MTAPVVSVVTPVYNGEQYLAECIESVLRQTLQEWEYVIVDNMSTDATASIADRFALQDARIRVVRSDQFLDVYGNHNRALAASDPRSRYCKMIQADDWIYPECLERMVGVAERNPSVGIVSAYALNGKRVQLDGLFSYSDEMMAGREAVRRFVRGSWVDWIVGGPSSILVRADFVRREREFFDRSLWHADSDAAFRVLMDSDLGFVHQVLTFMRGDNPKGLTSYSWRVYTFLASEGRMLIRYGPKIMSRDEYRVSIRRWLRRYGYWLFKQRLNLLRYRQQEFHDYHRREIEEMSAESGGDRETKLILSGFRSLLVNARSDRQTRSRTGYVETAWNPSS